MQLAMSVYYNQELTKRRQKDKRHHDLIAAVREGATQLGPTPRACYHCGQEGHFHRECPEDGHPGRQPCPQSGPCHLYKGNNRVSKSPHLQMEGGVPTPMDWLVPRPPVQAPLLSNNVEEPQVVIMVENWQVIFLLDSGARFSVLPFSLGPQSNDKAIARSITGQPLEHYFTQPLNCSWGELHLWHSFLMVSETPVALVRWDLLSQLNA
jgi:hypothetical protein